MPQYYIITHKYDVFIHTLAGKFQFFLFSCMDKGWNTPTKQNLTYWSGDDYKVLAKLMTTVYYDFESENNFEKRYNNGVIIIFIFFLNLTQ